MSGINRIERLKNFLKSDPEDAFLNYALAMEYLAIQSLQMAEKQLEWILEKHPDYIPVYYQLGKLRADSGNPDSAAMLYQTGIAKCKETGDAKTASELRMALEEIED